MAPATNGDAVDRSRFPEIVLDTTLAELLAEEPDWEVDEALCNIKPCADPRHKSLPLNKKYLITSSSIKDENDLAHLQLENVNYLLSFWAGRMEVPMVACEGYSSDDTLTKETIDENARKGFAVLNEKQRPWPKTFTNKDHFIEHFKNGKTKVRWGFAVDFAEQFPYFVHPEVQYQLNNKRWLAECPLRSANDRIIDPEGSCATHRTKDGLWYFGADCADCKESVKQYVDKLRDQLQHTEPPFVLKLAQSLGSVGTMLVKNKDDRDKTIEHVTSVQTESLPHLTADNAHIHPVSLVLSDFLPGDTNALNFYIRRDGSVRFLGACHQISTRNTEGGRQHTALTWSRQEPLERKFRATLAEIGRVLREETGYFGPCGADIMETDDGTQYVIDLNVRTSTSTVLGCLRGHCDRRGFDAVGVYECLLLSLSREALEEKFQTEFEQGRFVLLGNTRLGRKDVWAYPVVLAGEDLDAIKELGARILKFDAMKSGGADEATVDAGGA